MAASGIARIDALWQDSSAPALAAGAVDADAVGAVQDLLIGHGASRLPGILGSDRGLFGPRTELAIKTFQQERGLPVTGSIDHGTLHALAEKDAATPVAAQVYLTLTLDLGWTGFTRLVALTAQFEAAGKFTARNRNTDGAGLSFGIIQWAQKPGRLHELLRAFDREQRDRFTQVFGAGDRALADGLLAHTARPNGGVDHAGRTVDAEFDLVNEVWNDRFMRAGQDRGWQRTQVQEATTAFRKSLKRIRSIASVARSERAIAFLIDVANQHGDGGLASICAACTTPGITEAAFLSAVQKESVRKVKAQFGEDSAEARSTFNRREQFRTSPLLSDSEFLEV
jgi:peptidoglycan hydrolase-like protein with peptidoglycan-binding domain